MSDSSRIHIKAKRGDIVVLDYYDYETDERRAIAGMVTKVNDDGRVTHFNTAQGLSKWAGDYGPDRLFVVAAANLSDPGAALQAAGSLTDLEQIRLAISRFATDAAIERQRAEKAEAPERFGLKPEGERRA